MQKKVYETIQLYGMCPRGARMVVGVSGGADSVALLYLLNEKKMEEEWSLEVVHVHHGLRGLEADRDRDFVMGICEKLGLKCHVFHFQLEEEVKEQKMGLEEMGRALRQKAFKEIAKGDMIALAHHEDDQAETVLMRLCRGTSLQGLGGIKAIAGQIIHPLLHCSRAEIEAFCAERNLIYMTDSTNQETIYTRNKIRLEILPQLEKLYPKAKKHISNMAYYVTQEDEYMNEMARKIYQSMVRKKSNQIILPLEDLKKQHIVLQRRIFLKALQEFGLTKDISAKHIESIEFILKEQGSKELTFPKNIYIYKCYQTLIFQEGQFNMIDFSYTLSFEEEIFMKECDMMVKMELIPKETYLDTTKEKDIEYFDFDKLNMAQMELEEELVCRNRLIGDVIHLKNGRKKIKEYFINQKIPKQEREKIPLVAINHEIIWIIDEKVSKHYQVDEDTERIVKIEIQRKEASKLL